MPIEGLPTSSSCCSGRDTSAASAPLTWAPTWPGDPAARSTSLSSRPARAGAVRRGRDGAFFISWRTQPRAAARAYSPVAGRLREDGTRCGPTCASRAGPGGPAPSSRSWTRLLVVTRRRYSTPGCLGAVPFPCLTSGPDSCVAHRREEPCRSRPCSRDLPSPSSATPLRDARALMRRRSDSSTAWPRGRPPSPVWVPGSR